MSYDESKTNYILLLSFTLFLSSTILTGTSLPRIRYVPILFLALFFVVIGIKHTGFTIVAPRGILIAVTIIWTVYIIGSLIEPHNLSQLTRGSIFIFISATTLFVVPGTIPRETFLKILSIISAAVILIGIPALFLGDYSLGPFKTMLWRAGYNISGYSLPHLTSVMANPNPVGKVAFFGLISSYVWKGRARIQIFIGCLCLAGLLLTGSRAALLTTLASIIVLVLANSLNRDLFRTLILTFSAISATMFLILMRLIPGPEFLLSVDLSYRVGIWNAALEAALAKPILGHGPENIDDVVYRFKQGYVGAGVYNSFIRLFVTTGIFGFFSYLYIYAYSVLVYVPDLESREPVIVYAIVVGYAVDELFSGNSIFGISIMSVTASCLIGYIIRDSIGYNSGCRSYLR